MLNTNRVAERSHLGDGKPQPLPYAGRVEGDSLIAFADNYRLTERQREVLGHLVAGIAPKEMAYDFGVAESTIRFHAVQMYRKCAVRNQREMLALYARVSRGSPALVTRSE